MPQNFTFKNGSNGIFILCIFYHCKKNESLGFVSKFRAGSFFGMESAGKLKRKSLSLIYGTPPGEVIPMPGKQAWLTGTQLTVPGGS